MASDVHGTIKLPDKQHPALDIRHWESEFPLKDDRSEGGWVDTPRKLAEREQALRLAKSRGDLGPSVASDVFVWSHSGLRDSPWLTRIGGRPWRAKGKPWPRDEKGVPLVFLGQICFVDSLDVLPCKLPGEVALIFGSFHAGWVSLDYGSSLEWSPIKLENPDDGLDMPWNGELPYRYNGVRHRTVQYTDREAAEPAFKAAGYKDGGWGIRSVQATSIGTHASLPQGWPFEKNDGNLLIATLSSFYFRGQWPLCDVPSCLQQVYADGRTVEMWSDDAREFGIGDAGCLWIYRNKAGEFKLTGAGG